MSGARFNLYANAVQQALRSTMSDAELDLQLARLADEFVDVVAELHPTNPGLAVAA